MKKEFKLRLKYKLTMQKTAYGQPQFVYVFSPEESGSFVTVSGEKIVSIDENTDIVWKTAKDIKVNPNEEYWCNFNIEQIAENHVLVSRMVLKKEH